MAYLAPTVYFVSIKKILLCSFYVQPPFFKNKEYFLSNYCVHQLWKTPFGVSTRCSHIFQHQGCVAGPGLLLLKIIDTSGAPVGTPIYIKRSFLEHWLYLLFKCFFPSYKCNAWDSLQIIQWGRGRRLRAQGGNGVSWVLVAVESEYRRGALYLSVMGWIVSPWNSCVGILTPGYYQRDLIWR